VTSPETPTESGGRAGPPADERELIARCQAGDVAAFEPLVERYRQRVWRLAYQLLRDREEAWDCSQEVFVRAFHSIRSFRGESAFYTWLFRITVNLATDRQRAKGAQARAFGRERVEEEEWSRTMADPAAGPEEEAFGAERRERLRQALDALPPKARTIIMLSDVEGLTYREIAEVLRCPIGTVMSRLHNARKRLKAIVGPVLAVLFWIGASLWIAIPPADAQPVIRFGVRVLQATNTSTPDPAAPPASARPDQPSSVGTSPPPTARPTPAPPVAPPGIRDDPRLSRIVPQLRMLFRYTDYRPLEQYRTDGQIGIAQRFSIAGDRWLEVTPELLQGHVVRMRVRLLKGEQPEMNASIMAAPGAPAILGGPPHGEGVLIIILWANPKPRP
jgi:RNA polymerase sigma-70 factor (ECF subfamily)